MHAIGGPDGKEHQMTLGCKRLLAGGVVALGLLGAACSNYGGAAAASSIGAGGTTPAPASSTPATSGGGSTSGGAGTVTCAKSAGKASDVQQGFAFNPAKLAEKSCTTVTITNKDSVEHTFTIPGTAINVTVPPGSSSTAELALKPGKYVFYCRFHGSPDGTGMAGHLTVT
jgi:plastocyanin